MTGTSESQKGTAPAPPSLRTTEHLMDFVDTASIGLHWVAEDGTILWANPADYEPLGYTADEYIGHDIAEFHADPEVIDDILERLSAGERLDKYEARLLCKDGSIRHVEITSSVLFEEGPDEERRFVHTRCYTQDITERKRMEEARDRFVRMLAHDLRTPLNAISMAADLLLDAPDVSEAHAETVERIAESSERMSRMITELTELARGLGGKMLLERRPMDFAELCGRILDEVQLAAPEISIAMEAQGEMRGEWDPERLGQAVSNLLTNAVEHGEPPYRVTLLDTGPAIVLRVSNHGDPIPSEMLPRLFEPFSHEPHADNLGLGLFIVREIVQAHGGTIDVHSDPDSATVVTTHWPRADERSQSDH